MSIGEDLDERLDALRELLERDLDKRLEIAQEHIEKLEKLLPIYPALEEQFEQLKTRCGVAEVNIDSLRRSLDKLAKLEKLVLPPEPQEPAPTIGKKVELTFYKFGEKYPEEGQRILFLGKERAYDHLFFFKSSIFTKDCYWCEMPSVEEL